jgi:hypothetical protein
MQIHRLVALVAISLLTVGCAGPEAPEQTGGSTADSHGHDHADEHGHDHSDEGHSEDGHDENGHGEAAHAPHGPNGGHIFKFDSPDFIGEWQKFKDNSIIKMHIMDKDQKPVLADVDSFKVIPLTGKDRTPFELEAENADDAGLSSVYSLDDQGLSIAIPLGVSIEVVMGDKTLKGQIDQHEPLDH